MVRVATIDPSRLGGPLLALTAGHLSVDMCGGALWALLPFLVVERGYSYAAVGMFAMTASIAGAVLQPVLGALGDRRPGFWLMLAGLTLTGFGIGVIGIVASYPLTLAAVVVTSAGQAAYHPEGARWARRVSGGRINRDMGVFSVGGSVGYALGPLIVAATLAPLGLAGTLIIPLIPWAAALVLIFTLPRRRRARTAHRMRELVVEGRSEWRPFVLLLVYACIGGGVITTLMTYVPLYLVQEVGKSPGASSVATSILLAAGAAGTLLGGLAAQRYGRRLALVVPQLALAPLIVVLPALGYGATLPMVAVVGIAMNCYMSISLVLAQEYLPAHMGLATGLSIGLAGGVSGLIAAAFSALAARSGPGTVLLAVAVLPLIVAAIGAWLPRPAATLQDTVPVAVAETGQ